MAVRRYLFSELPYAFAIRAKWMRSHCTSCLSELNAVTKRGCDCGTAFYCNETCRDEDEQLHRFECMAIIRWNVTDKAVTRRLMTYPVVRLLGRMIVRRWSDNGKASLSRDFPNDIAQNRCVDDLMTHKTHMMMRLGAFWSVKNDFYKFFDRTPLSSVAIGSLFLAYCRFAINSFGVANYTNAYLGEIGQMGTAVYLNASRFNHSCRPSCVYTFDGVRLIIDYIDYNDEHSSAPVKMTKEQFESLTLCYGYCTSIAIPRTKQRIRSLKKRYFFHCRCEWCSDNVLNLISDASSPAECSVCSWPYVWRRTGLTKTPKMGKICRCGDKDEWRENEFKTAPWLLEKDAATNVETLLKEWRRVMKTSESPECLSVAYSRCKVLLAAAKKYWHPTYNVRLGQLAEKLHGLVWNCVIMIEKDRIPRESVQWALDSGETMMAIYGTYYQPHLAMLAAYAARMGLLYKGRSKVDGDNDSQRADHWFKSAMCMWKQRFEPLVDYEKYMVDLASFQNELKMVD